MEGDVKKGYDDTFDVKPSREAQEAHEEENSKNEEDTDNQGAGNQTGHAKPLRRNIKPKFKRRCVLVPEA